MQNLIGSVPWHVNTFTITMIGYIDYNLHTEKHGIQLQPCLLNM